MPAWAAQFLLALVSGLLGLYLDKRKDLQGEQAIRLADIQVKLIRALEWERDAAGRPDGGGGLRVADPDATLVLGPLDGAAAPVCPAVDCPLRRACAENNAHIGEQ